MSKDSTNLGRGHTSAQPKPGSAIRCSIARSTKHAFSCIAFRSMPLSPAERRNLNWTPFAGPRGVGFKV
jgi:hypothetical protein